MSTENNTNEQIVTKRRGPDLRFVIGLIAAIICVILLIVYYTGYRTGSVKAYEDLQKDVQLLKTAVDKHEVKLEKLEKQNVVTELHNLTKAVESFKESYDSVNLKQPESPSEGNQPASQSSETPAPSA